MSAIQGSTVVITAEGEVNETREELAPREPGRLQAKQAKRPRGRPKGSKTLVPDAAKNPEVELLSPAAVATFLGVSQAYLRVRVERGLIPAPVGEIGYGKKWSRTELLAWIHAGMPAQAGWLKVREKAIATWRGGTK